MNHCTLCGLFTEERLVGARPEIDYETGLQVMRRNICRECSNNIAFRNGWFQEFAHYFNSHPGRLEALEALHEEDIKA